MVSMPDAIETSGQKALSPFAETIILTTLFWKSINLKRVLHVDKIPGVDIWEHHHRLYHVAQQRLMLLSLPPCSPELLNPMRLFTNMLANSTIIWFYSMLEVLRGTSNDRSILVPLHSAYEIASLVRPLIRSSFFKVSERPFFPCFRAFWVHVSRLTLCNLGTCILSNATLSLGQVSPNTWRPTADKWISVGG
jgi:hypothetical protein